MITDVVFATVKVMEDKGEKSIGLYQHWYIPDTHCVKSPRIWYYSGPHSVRMQENTDRNNSEYRDFSRSY